MLSKKLRTAERHFYRLRGRSARTRPDYSSSRPWCLVVRHASAGAGAQTTGLEQSSVFLLEDGTGMDGTLNPARNGWNRPVSWPVRDAASSVPVCTPARGIPAVPDGTGTELMTVGWRVDEVVVCFFFFTSWAPPKPETRV